MALPDEPNVILQLATSVTERGIAGYTHSVTNQEDQRKVNVIYEPTKNPMTGKGTLDLVKRPGVTDSSFTLGTSTQTPYLLITSVLGGAATFPVIFNTLGADLRASSSLTTNTILLSGTGDLPCFTDKTKLSGTENLVLQTRTSAISKHRAFYSTDNSTWTEITDADFTGLLHRGKMEHMDGFAFILDNQGRIFNSDVNSLASWTATNFITKSIKQDRTVGLARLNNHILAFSEKSVEVFYNAGNTTGSPLGRLSQLSAEIGMVAAVDGAVHNYAVLNDKLYFVGRNAGGQFSLSLFVYGGQDFQKVSSPYIDKILSEKAMTIYSVFPVGFLGQSAIAIDWTSPTSTSHRFLLFFPEWREWFEWNSDVFSPVNCGSWFLGCASGKTNKVYGFAASDNWQDDGVSYLSSTQFKLPTKGSSRNTLNMYGVDAATARSANDLLVEISRDDCHTFETLGTIDLTQDRKVLFRGGAFRNAHIRLSNTNAIETRIHNFVARLNG